jgi:hypothetical protein
MMLTMYYVSEVDNLLINLELPVQVSHFPKSRQLDGSRNFLLM